MNISVLTSRFGPSNKQVDRFEQFVSTKFESSLDKFFHGGDKGDEDIHDKLMLQKYSVEIYPCLRSEAKEEFHGVKINDELRLDDRNRKLVEIAEAIIGIPQYMNGWEDSPFWKTVRAAIAADKKIYLISPEGYCYQFTR